MTWRRPRRVERTRTLLEANRARLRPILMTTMMLVDDLGRIAERLRRLPARRRLGDTPARLRPASLTGDEPVRGAGAPPQDRVRAIPKAWMRL